MSESGALRYSLSSLFWLVAAVAVPLGLSIGWSVNLGLVLCVAIAFALFIVTRKPGFLIAMVAYLISLVFVWTYIFGDVASHGPYVRWYNERLERMAINAKLVGDSEARVEAILGPPTEVSSGWDRWDMETGMPTPDAEYRTTYNYAPYASFPFAKFQVHCKDGIVQSIELYDD